MARQLHVRGLVSKPVGPLCVEVWVGSGETSRGTEEDNEPTGRARSFARPRGRANDNTEAGAAAERQDRRSRMRKTRQVEFQGRGTRPRT